MNTTDLEKLSIKEYITVITKEIIERIDQRNATIINYVGKHVVNRFVALEDRVEKVEHQLQQA